MRRGVRRCFVFALAFLPLSLCPHASSLPSLAVPLVLAFPFPSLSAAVSLPLHTPPFLCDDAASSSRERVSPSCLWSAGFSPSSGRVRPPLLLCTLLLRFDALPFFPSPFHLPFGALSACRLVGIGERVGLRRVPRGLLWGVDCCGGGRGGKEGGRKKKNGKKGRSVLPAVLLLAGLVRRRSLLRSRGPAYLSGSSGFRRRGGAACADH